MKQTNTSLTNVFASVDHDLLPAKRFFYAKCFSLLHTYPCVFRAVLYMEYINISINVQYGR